jgi:hypothetical protein
VHPAAFTGCNRSLARNARVLPQSGAAALAQRDGNGSRHSRSRPIEQFAEHVQYLIDNEGSTRFTLAVAQ